MGKATGEESAEARLPCQKWEALCGCDHVKRY